MKHREGSEGSSLFRGELYLQTRFILWGVLQRSPLQAVKFVYYGQNRDPLSPLQNHGGLLG